MAEQTGSKKPPLIINDFTVAISPYLPIPTIKLTPAAPVSEEFRKEMNAWLYEMFGGHNCIVMTIFKTVAVSEDVYDKLALAIQNERANFRFKQFMEKVTGLAL
jgi:hypothetical protein